MSVDERIPVSEERMKELGDLKEPGQSYDDLLGELVQTYREQRLAETIRENRKNGEFVEVDPDDW